MSISTHVLDTAKGLPGVGIAVELDFHRGGDRSGEWETLNAARTDLDGRVTALLPEGVAMEPGVYTVRFATGAYFAREGLAGLYPVVEITFTVSAGQAHYHVPLLLAANGYTTYRGS
jgi:5-hydroxyisourate hydrolase